MTGISKKISAKVHISDEIIRKRLRFETDKLFVYTVRKAIYGYTSDEKKRIISSLISKLK